MQTSEAKRWHFDGMLRVVRFNWPVYAIAAGFALALFLPMFFAFLPWTLRLLSAVLAGLIVLQALASLAASHLVYDLSPLKDWRWLTEVSGDDGMPVAGGSRIVNVHSGYDETSSILRGLFPDCELSVVDLYPALAIYEPSIERARALYPPKTAPVCTTIDAWPMADASVDLVLIAFAAHELRTPEQREKLFCQARQILSEGGKIILVEHLRDFFNFVAFGPGFFHFFPQNEWRRCIAGAGLKVEKYYKITPLVGVFIICP